MKKNILFVFLFLLIVIPFNVKAESNYLYDVIKEEAESGGLAREYTGAHRDSYTKEPTHKIYHWYSEDSEEGTQILSKNNVLFGGFCWQMIRTTDVGGVRLIYNGVPENNKCLQTRGNHDGYNYVINQTLQDYYWYGTNYTYDAETKNFTITGDLQRAYMNSTTGPGLVGKYTCKNTSSTATCTTLYYVSRYKPYPEVISIPSNMHYSEIGETLFNDYFNYLGSSGYMYKKTYKLNMKKIQASDNFVYGKNYDYYNGNFYLYDTTNIGDVTTDEAHSSLSSHHFTCFSTSSTCSTIYFIFYIDDNTISYIELNNDVDINSLINEVYNASDINIEDSNIKRVVDEWYRRYLVDYSDFIEDTIYCDNRIVSDVGGFSTNGNVEQLLTFKKPAEFNSLTCERNIDSFSVSNNSAKLKYPVGLAGSYEMRLLGDNNTRATGKTYYLMSQYSMRYDNYGAWEFFAHAISRDGRVSYANNTYLGVRPSISLISNLKYASGDGSQNNPYIIRKLVKNRIVINDNQNGQFSNIESENLYEELDKIQFTVEPPGGYLLNSLSIKDANNNDVDFQQIDNSSEYSFIMPATDVTITPIYEKVKSSVNVEFVNETEDITVEINDMTQVEYEEKVKFNVNPIKGYKVTSLKIIDKDNNELEYETTDDKNYTFTMPASDVTIIPSYERVKNAVTVEDNKNTKEIKIEVNDATAVVYENKVVFEVVPEEGYVVEEIIIKDNNNNIINYKEKGDNKYEFTMPDIDVVITPTYKKIESINIPNTLKNPNTRTEISFIIIFMLIISSITYIIFKRKKKLFKYNSLIKL